MSSPTYLKYSADVESPAPDEKSTIQGIIDGMMKQSEIVAKRQNGLAVRASHAKSTGLLTGTLEIASDLPEDLAQGLFSHPGKYDVAVRMAQGPGEILHDKVSTHRGLSIKVLGVDGAKLPGEDHKSQDFVLASGPTFPSGTAAGFLRDHKMLLMATPMPDTAKSIVASVARNANSASEAITGAPSPLADFFGHPFTHPLSEPYYSQAPLRFGDYVAKLAAFPVEGRQLQELQKVKIDTNKDENAFRTAVVSHFSNEGFAWEIRAQLWNDRDSQPIEDTSVQWPEDQSPYRTIATLRVPAQNAHSPERQKFFDEILSFRPSNALEAHKPLGSVMRARMQVYDALSRYRHDTNRVKLEEPANISQIPA